MKNKILIMILSLMAGSILFARSNITINKQIWELGERIEIKYSGTNASLRYKIGAFRRGTSNNSNPIKTRSFKNKTSGSVFMRLRADQGVKPGRYEFHLYKKGSNNILSKVNLILKSSGTTDPPTDPPTGNRNFTASSGTTDLNYADTTTFIAEYSKLGYKNLKYQKTVKKSQLSSMLAARNNMHFHSGHGAPNGTINCTDGNLSASSLSGKIQVKYSIYCICSSFASSSWSKVMGSNAQMVMGFNKTVTDGSCKSLASGFPAQLKSGQSYKMAWYKANSAISGHKDRWSMYVKEGSKVVLYKAGGNTPRDSFTIIPYVLSDKVAIDETLLKKWDRLIKFDQDVIIAILEENPVFNRNLPKGKFPFKKTNMTKKQAKQKAKKRLKDFGGLPIDAKLSYTIPIERCIDDVCSNIAYTLYYTQQYEGLEIRSTYNSNYISVLVDDEGIKSLQSNWSNIISVGEILQDRILSVGDALQISSHDISNLVRSPIIIVDYKKVYGIYKNTIIPAYEFIGDQDERFVVNAITGELI